jgi:hypothetical protein
MTANQKADLAALRAILRERLEGVFVSAEEMRTRTEALITRKRSTATPGK